MSAMAVWCPTWRHGSISGSSGRTADLAAAVTATVVDRLVASDAGRDLAPGVHAVGDASLAGLDLLHHATRRGVTVQEFTGVARATHW
mgnify:CR=1 FL=1